MGVRTSDYNKKDTSGWSITSAGASTYDSTRTLKRDSTAVTDGKDKVRVRTDIINGDYSVYKVNKFSTDTLVYTWDGATDQQTISDEDLYEEFFVGPATTNTYLLQSASLNLNTKEDTLALAAKNANTDIELRRLQELEELIGFRSLTNTGAPPPPDSSGASPNSPDGEQSSNTNPSNVETDDSLGSDSSEFLWSRPSYTSNRAGVVYRYPLNIPDLGYDFIKITAYEYVASGLPTPGRRRNPRRLLNRPLERIILPMQPNLSETNSVDWGRDTMNAIQAAGAQAAMSAIGDLSKVDMTALGNTANETMGNLKKMINDPNAGPFIKAYFAGQAVGVNNATARATGTVINPNLELLFSGPRLRTFNFNFTFTPRSTKEAREVKKIIKTFKRNMAPQRSPSNLFLKTPRIFQLEYIYNDTDRQHPFLNKFKPCAMTNFSVNYTPDGSYMTYGDDGSLTSYAVTMAFGELEPIYADEIDSSWRDMGY